MGKEDFVKYSRVRKGLSRHVFTFGLELLFGVERGGGRGSFKGSLLPVPKFLLFSLDDSEQDQLNAVLKEICPD